MFKSAFPDGSLQLCMPSAGLSLLFPSLDLSDLISVEIISLENSIRELKKVLRLSLFLPFSLFPWKWDLKDCQQ